MNDSGIPMLAYVLIGLSSITLAFVTYNDKSSNVAPQPAPIPVATPVNTAVQPVAAVQPVVAKGGKNNKSKRSKLMSKSKKNVTKRQCK